MKKAVAYCRVSTNKEEQLDSLESQQNFFQEYAIRNNYNLINIYADEGKSGTKMKNRTQLLQLLSDSEQNEYDLVLIKDVSRLARNTVDFLTSIRKLKALGIKVIFVNYDQTSSESSEFMLTMLSAIAQEESANTSKRVKFGKKQNAEKGKVPNLVYGYDKIARDYFNMNINEKEAEIVKRIFHMYSEQGMGTTRIAKELNKAGIKTKRDCCWNQCGITRILTNEIYTGRIINGKEEVVDFLTGARSKVQKQNQMVTYRPGLQIIEEATFKKANKLLESRKYSFRQTRERESDKQIFSKLIYCKCCGTVFRRIVRTYKNTYVKWVCSGRNSLGVDVCPNKTVVEESELLFQIRNFIVSTLNNYPQVVQTLPVEYNRRLKSINKRIPQVTDYTSKINKTLKIKQKYMELYENDIICVEELKEIMNKVNNEVMQLERNLKLIEYTNYYVLDNEIHNETCTVESIVISEQFTNNFLRKFINRITVDEFNNIEIYLKQLE